jgi:hypothetical protein
VYAQGAVAPSCVTVTALPATLTDPARAAPVLGAMLRLTVPLPVRALPAVTLIHGALLTDVHEQPPVVATVSGAGAPPAALMLTLVGATVNAHEVAAS